MLVVHFALNEHRGVGLQRVAANCLPPRRLGAYAAGAITVVINERYRPRQIEHALHHAEASAFITSQPMLDRQRNLMPPPEDVWEEK